MRKKPIGRSLDKIVQRRVSLDASFAGALLEQVVERLLAGDMTTARSLVRDLIKGTVGYAELGRRTGTPEKSLVRMFGPRGNPTAANFANVLHELQRVGRVRLRVRSQPRLRRDGESRSSAPARMS